MRWFLYSSRQLHHIRTTNRKFQTWTSKAQRGGTACPGLTEMTAKRQREAVRLPHSQNQLEGKGQQHLLPHLPRPPSAPLRASAPHPYNGMGGSPSSLAPSVHHCVTDGRETRVGAGVSPSQGVRQPGSPGPPHTAGQEVKQSLGRWGEKGLGMGERGREVENWG